MDKIAIAQTVRTIFNIVAILVVLEAICFGQTSTTIWNIVVGTVVLWFIGDTAVSTYLECLYEREES